MEELTLAKKVRRWWSPWWAKVLVVVVILGVLFIGGSALAARFTSRAGNWGQMELVNRS